MLVTQSEGIENIWKIATLDVARGVEDSMPKQKRSKTARKLIKKTRNDLNRIIDDMEWIVDDNLGGDLSNEEIIGVLKIARLKLQFISSRLFKW